MPGVISIVGEKIPLKLHGKLVLNIPETKDLLAFSKSVIWVQQPREIIRDSLSRMGFDTIISSIQKLDILPWANRA